jgi:hypothetical protein
MALITVHGMYAFEGDYFHESEIRLTYKLASAISSIKKLQLAPVDVIVEYIPAFRGPMALAPYRIYVVVDDLFPNFEESRERTKTIKHVSEKIVKVIVKMRSADYVVCKVIAPSAHSAISCSRKTFTLAEALKNSDQA